MATAEQHTGAPGSISKTPFSIAFANKTEKRLTTTSLDSSSCVKGAFSKGTQLIQQRRLHTLQNYPVPLPLYRVSSLETFTKLQLVPLPIIVARQDQVTLHRNGAKGKETSLGVTAHSTPHLAASTQRWDIRKWL